MAKHKRFTVLPGNSLTLGVHREEKGYNFAVSVPDGEAASLLLYRRGEKEPVEEILLPEEDRVGTVSAVLLPELRDGIYEYNYCIGGAIVQDPYAKEIHGLEHFGKSLEKEERHAVRCGLSEEGEFDWEGERPMFLPYEDLILYKLHVRGYTKQAPVKHKGTFAGLQEMIPYFQKLGINGIELMPAYEFLEMPLPREEKGLVTSFNREERVNFWGYQEGFYFAPKRSYCSGKDPAWEVKEMVKALHKAGIECIMEFFFPRDVNPLLALEALRHWRITYHIDGFHLVGEGVPRDLIMKDAILCTSKLMMDGFDPGAVYGDKVPRRRCLAEYHQGFQQDLRRFLKSDEDTVPGALYRIRRNPATHGVINYMVSQDGFTLRDLVSYDYRHNEANGEDNRDGSSYNFSWNCGVEGPTRKKQVLAVRNRQMRNAFLMMLLSQGTPMLYGGDEFGNSQDGNNNAWCQDNPVGWVNWKNQKKNQELQGFVSRAIAFRKEHSILHMPKELKGMDYEAVGFPDVSVHSQRAWFGSFDNTSRCAGLMYAEHYGREKLSGFLYVAYNFHWEPRELALPNLPEEACWSIVLDTGCPQGFLEEPVPLEKQKTVTVQPRTILVLLGK